MTRAEAIEHVINIIADQDWLSGDESWDYGEDGAMSYHPSLATDFDIRPVAERIVDTLLIF